MRINSSSLLEKIRTERNKNFTGIEPAAPRWQVLGGIDQRRLGLAVIANVLEQEGWKVKNYYEKMGDPLSDFDSLITNNSIVGISTITCTAPRAYELAQQIKREYAQVPVIMGGFHPSARPDEALEYADIVVRGEGEETIYELLCTAKPLEEIPGISFWRDGEKVHNPNRRFLDKLSYRNILTDSELIKAKTVPVLFSRGCPYKCTFCAVSHVMGAKMRYRPVAEVIRELKHLKQIGVKQIFIVDDNFFGDLDTAVELLRTMVKEGIKIPIGIQMRADLRISNNPEILKLMKQAGIFILLVGLEFVEENGLKEVQKGLKLSQIKEFIITARKWNFTLYNMFIFGCLKDNTDTPQKIIEFMKQYSPYELIQIMFMVPFPGTKLEDELKDKIFDWDWANYDANHVVWQHPQMQPPQQYESLLKAYKAWYHPFNVGKILAQKFLTGQWQTLALAPLFLKGIYHTMRGWEKMVQKGAD
ncbi:MAG: B12-binding domain-containing radical SAM protein [Candidatus Schekmanbacteria bacterium]|nr:B12-binding domain-containing radical SAM protein [Candidatus Schekmanbacteria bacterium]